MRATVYESNQIFHNLTFAEMASVKISHWNTVVKHHSGIKKHESIKLPQEFELSTEKSVRRVCYIRQKNRTIVKLPKLVAFFPSFLFINFIKQLLYMRKPVICL